VPSCSYCASKKKRHFDFFFLLSLATLAFLMRVLRASTPRSPARRSTGHWTRTSIKSASLEGEWESEEPLE